VVDTSLAPDPAPLPAPATPAPASSARGLTKVYGSGPSAVRALDGVDVDFRAGAFTAIMGPSGSGKSTLMHLLAGLDTATSGTVRLGETDITRLGDRALTTLRRERIGFVFQSFNLLPMFTAAQNIVLPLELAGAQVDAAWYETLVETLGLGPRLAHRPAELSGGQQQRVAIARALVTKPDVVFADEPTGNLDSRSGAEVLSFLRRSVRELGRTVVMVTHDAAAAAYADRVVLLADGRIAGEIVDPTPESVLLGLDALRSSLGDA
jgi:putative ABC transport system ATP-binding protein